MGILDQILAAVDNTKRVASRNTKDLFTDTENFISKLTGQLDESNKKMASRDSESVNEAIANMIPGGGAVGMIRKGGAPNLNAVHNLTGSRNEILELLSGRASLSSPSIAIAKNNISPFQQAPTLLYNPSSPLIDPAQHNVNQLINRDAYTTRARTPAARRAEPVISGKDPELDLTQRDTSVIRRKGDMRFGEGGGPPEDSHMAAIAASPSFSSFADYETNRYGAKTLSSDMRAVDHQSYIAGEQYAGFLTDSGKQNTSIRNLANMNYLREQAASGNSAARDTLDTLRSVPSTYAELKAVGEVPIQPRDVSALIIPAHYKPDEVAQYKAAGAKTGIRIGTPEELLPADSLTKYDDLAAEAHKLITANSDKFGLTRSGYNNLPEAVRKYFDLQTADSVSAGLKPARQVISESDQFAADVASLLTTIDANR